MCILIILSLLLGVLQFSTAITSKVRYDDDYTNRKIYLEDLEVEQEIRQRQNELLGYEPQQQLLAPPTLPTHYHNTNFKQFSRFQHTSSTRPIIKSDNYDATSTNHFTLNTNNNDNGQDKQQLSGGYALKDSAYVIIPAFDKEMKDETENFFHEKHNAIEYGTLYRRPTLTQLNQIANAPNRFGGSMLPLIPALHPPTYISITRSRPEIHSSLGRIYYDRQFEQATLNRLPDIFYNRHSQSYVDSYTPSWTVAKMLQHQQEQEESYANPTSLFSKKYLKRETDANDTNNQKPFQKNTLKEEILMME